MQAEVLATSLALLGQLEIHCDQKKRHLALHNAKDILVLLFQLTI